RGTVAISALPSCDLRWSCGGLSILPSGLSTLPLASWRINSRKPPTPQWRRDLQSRLVKEMSMPPAVLMVSVLLIAHVLGGCDSKPNAGASPPPPVTVARPLEKTITEWDE